MSALMSALVAALLSVAPVVPARGASDVPLVHVSGWNRVVTAQSGPTSWEYDTADEDVAFTLAADESIEVKLGGSCTVNGVTHRSQLFRHAFCYGSGQYGGA